MQPSPTPPSPSPSRLDVQKVNQIRCLTFEFVAMTFSKVSNRIYNCSFRSKTWPPFFGTHRCPLKPSYIQGPLAFEGLFPRDPSRATSIPRRHQRPCHLGAPSSDGGSPRHTTTPRHTKTRHATPQHQRGEVLLVQIGAPCNG